MLFLKRFCHRTISKVTKKVYFKLINRIFSVTNQQSKNNFHCLIFFQLFLVSISALYKQLCCFRIKVLVSILTIYTFYKLNKKYHQFKQILFSQFKQLNKANLNCSYFCIDQVYLKQRNKNLSTVFITVNKLYTAFKNQL